MKILVSACLLGQAVRYDGGTCTVDSALLKEWVERGLVIPFCPEGAGGLPVPRPPAEIRGSGGESVLEGSGQVVTEAGADVTQAFLHGAWSALEAATAAGVRVALLKEASPSCGSRTIHDGTLSGRRIPGQGVTAALLRRNGIVVLGEEQVGTAEALGEGLSERKLGDSIWAR